MVIFKLLSIFEIPTTHVFVKKKPTPIKKIVNITELKNIISDTLITFMISFSKFISRTILIIYIYISFRQRYLKHFASEY